MEEGEGAPGLCRAPRDPSLEGGRKASRRSGKTQRGTGRVKAGLGTQRTLFPSCESGSGRAREAGPARAPAAILPLLEGRPPSTGASPLCPPAAAGPVTSRRRAALWGGARAGGGTPRRHFRRRGQSRRGAGRLLREGAEGTARAGGRGCCGAAAPAPLARDRGAAPEAAEAAHPALSRSAHAPSGADSASARPAGAAR